MIVRNVKDVIGTADEVRTDTWVSRRVLLKKDGMGFSFHETTIFPAAARTSTTRTTWKRSGASRATARSRPSPTARPTRSNRAWSMP